MNERISAFFSVAVEYAVPIGAVVVCLVAGYIIRKVLFYRLNRWARATDNKMDDVIISSIKGPFIIWFLLLGLFVALRLSEFPERVVNVVEKAIMVLAIVSVTFVAANIAGRLIKTYASRVDAALPVTSLTQYVSRIVIIIVGFLLILNALGISITPILATLGIGGLAVALALQDTLANLFAGFHIVMAKQMRVGDYIKLESGEEGYITDIGWRSTKIRMLPNNIVLVPNDKLAKSIVTNYYLPEQALAVLVNVGVHYGTDLERAEAITIEVAREVMREVKGGVPEFEPFIRYNAFGDSSINFTAILRAREFVDQYLVKHEFVKRLQARYAKEGIVIPFPIRAINYDQERGR